MREAIIHFPDLDAVGAAITNTQLEVNGIKISWLRYYCPVDQYSAADAGDHHHSFYELHSCLSGECAYEVEGQSYKVKTGETLLIAAERAHRELFHTPDYGKVAMGFAVPIGEDSVMTMLTECLSAQTAVVFPSGEQIESAYYRILEEFAAQKPGYLTVVRGRLLEIMIAAARESAKDTYSVADRDHRIDERICRLNEYLNQAMSRRMTLNELSEALHMSKRQLERLVEKEFDCTVMTYINRRKSDYARDLLVNSDQSIRSIALACGFSDEFSFGRFFKRMEGMPPGILRRSRFQKRIKNKKEPE